jgi:hypothetical protein
MLLADFWEATITETHMFIQAYRWRLDEQRRTMMWHAWHTAALAGASFGQGGIPALSSLLPARPGPRPRALTLDQEATLWRAWAQEHNLKRRRPS